MIRKAFDRDVPPVDADDAFHHSDLDLLIVEISALFDVQLKIRRDVAPFATNSSEFRGISADQRDSLANRFATATDEIQFAFGEFAVHRAAADQPAFLDRKSVVQGTRVDY